MHFVRLASLRAFMAAALGAVAAVAVPVKAADYPDRPIRLIVPWPAGGSTDLAGRAFAQNVGPHLGGNVIVENRPGANAMVGADAAAKAAPNGYTLLVASSETHAINPYVYDKLPYNPSKDFIAIGAYARNPYALVARADFPADNVAALVEVVKKNPGKYTYASASLGSASQIVMEMLKQQTGMDILHVPFQGEAPAVNALMGGQVDMQILPVGRAQVLAQSGKLKVYAVTQGERYAGLPNVPTLKELGYDGLVVANWFGIMVPAGTPQPVVDKLSSALAATARDPAMLKALEPLALTPFPQMSREQFQQFVSSESQRWGKVIEAAHIKASN
jgi:tripartite-type tricarboxylate transporter receptor subunit TctC